jgi:rubrerythrin
MRTTQLRTLLLDALMIGTAATAGCASQAPPSQRPTGATASAPCVDGMRNVLVDLKPAQPIDYVELRQRFEGAKPDKGARVLAHGRPCEHAVSPDECRTALLEPVDGGFGSACHPLQCDFNLVVTDARGVRRIVSVAELAAFTGPVDTPSEALLLAFANGHWVLGCNEPLPAKVGDEWQVTVRTMVEECPVVYADVTLAIGSSGVVKVARTENRVKDNTCVGRRPAGLRSAATYAGGATGSYLAAAAHLEAASVPAFEQLGSELEGLGAPRRLARLCRRAAADERRHARVMGRLASTYGRRAPEVVLDDVKERDAMAIAIDNAAEGCVRETFGALMGLYQAEHARDVRVRMAMRAIARDEVRHAALAWKIAAWIEPRLSPREANHVQRTRARAVGTLREELRAEPPAELRETLGLPRASVATRMADVLERTLWRRP